MCARPEKSPTDATAPKRQPRRAGIFQVEVITAVFVVALLVTLLGTLAAWVREMDAYYLARWSARLAAEGQMERYVAGLPLSVPPPPEVVAPGVALRTESAPGGGPWAGLQRVVVTAEVTLPPLRQPVKCRVIRYLPMPAGPTSRTAISREERR